MKTRCLVFVILQESDHIFIFHPDNDIKMNNIRINWDYADFKRQLGS